MTPFLSCQGEENGRAVTAEGRHGSQDQTALESIYKPDARSTTRASGERATRSERAGEAARESACRAAEGRSLSDEQD